MFYLPGWHFLVVLFWSLSESKGKGPFFSRVKCHWVLDIIVVSPPPHPQKIGRVLAIWMLLFLSARLKCHKQHKDKNIFSLITAKGNSWISAYGAAVKIITAPITPRQFLCSPDMLGYSLHHPQLLPMLLVSDRNFKSPKDLEGTRWGTGRINIK